MTPTPSETALSAEERLWIDLADLRDHGYQPSYNGRPLCPVCLNFIDAEEGHARGCLLVEGTAARSQPATELDVERLARAMEEVDGPGYWAPEHATDVARKYAAEYAALTASESRVTDHLAAKDRSAAEHSDTRSECPECGEWRDSPTSDCANCGFDPSDTRSPEQVDDDLDAMASGNFM